MPKKTHTPADTHAKEHTHGQYSHTNTQSYTCKQKQMNIHHHIYTQWNTCTYRKKHTYTKTHTLTKTLAQNSNTCTHSYINTQAYAHKHAYVPHITLALQVTFGTRRGGVCWGGVLSSGRREPPRRMQVFIEAVCSMVCVNVSSAQRPNYKVACILCAEKASCRRRLPDRHLYCSSKTVTKIMRSRVWAVMLLWSDSCSTCCCHPDRVKGVINNSTTNENGCSLQHERVGLSRCSFLSH